MNREWCRYTFPLSAVATVCALAGIGLALWRHSWGGLALWSFLLLFNGLCAVTNYVGAYGGKS